MTNANTIVEALAPWFNVFDAFETPHFFDEKGFFVAICPRDGTFVVHNKAAVPANNEVQGLEDLLDRVNAAEGDLEIVWNDLNR